MKSNEKPKPSGKGPIQERTRRTILDHAARLFRERGYASTSLRDIATATGMKAGSLYYHFESKEDLAEEVLSQGIALVEERVRATIATRDGDADPVEVIRQAMVAHLKALHERGDYASANIRCYAHVPADVKNRLRKLRAGYEDLWQDLIAASIAAGRLKPSVDAMVLRYALIGMMNWTLEWRRGASPSAEDLAAGFFGIAFAGALADG